MSVEAVRKEFIDGATPKEAMLVERITNTLGPELAEIPKTDKNLATKVMALKLLRAGIAETRIPRLIIAADMFWRAAWPLGGGNAQIVDDLGGPTGLVKMLVESDPSMNQLERILNE